MERTNCAHCKHSVSYSDNYCVQCGTSLAATGQTSPLRKEWPPEGTFRRRRSSVIASLLAASLVALIAGFFVFRALWSVPEPVPSTDQATQPSQSIIYTVYHDRRSWETAISNRIAFFDDLEVEDFEKEDSSNADLVVSSRIGFSLKFDGHSSARILEEALLPTGKQLYLVDDQLGSTLWFQHGEVSAFGFDYRAEHDWTLRFGNNSALTLPQSERAFVGIVYEEIGTHWFWLASNVDHGEMAIDNITFLPKDHEIQR